MDAILDKIWLTPFLLARVLVFIRVLPFMGTNTIPRLAMTAFACTLAPLLLPIFIHDMPDEPVNILLGFALIVKEIILGFLFAFLAGLLFWAIMGMGFIIDNQRGNSQGDTTDPLSQEQTSPLGSFFFQWATLIFCSSGAFTLFIGGFLESYVWWPVFSATPPINMAELYEFLLGQISNFFILYVMLCAPVIAVFFLTDFSLGLVNRFAQQLNVFILSMGIKSGIMLIVLVYYVSILQGIFLDDFLELPHIFSAIKGVWYGGK